MAFKKIVFIVNPHSGSGGTGREWPRIQAAAKARFGTALISCLTSGPGDAARIARSQLLDGADVIVCVGGDGTLNEVVNGFMDEEGPIRKDARLGFIPNGTGCDFVKTVSIPRRLEESLDTIQQGHALLIDLGRLRYGHHNDVPTTRFFHNITSFGLGGEVDARVNRTTKAFGPFISFIWSTLIAILLYGKKTIRLKIDNHYDEEIKIWNVAVANGQYHGGGMRVAPEAVINDGLFHITVIGDVSLAGVFRHLPKLYNGKISEIKEVSCLTGKKVEAFSHQPVLLDVDGEQPGNLPAAIDIMPSALWVIMKSSVSKG
ncbi:MAG: diacylglycerol kinase family protein [Syntrophales bacterium]